jgi:16S rRNA (guanine527-N7)-methyltransferase
MNIDWLSRALEESRARGFLGPGSIEPHIAHAMGFADCWADVSSTPPSSFLDLGSGGGLPGLVLLDYWGCRGVFVDSMEKRMNFLREVLAWPGAPQLGEVITGRAEDIARDPSLDGSFDLVTARSFGPPAVVAECAVRFLKVGGVLIVSEPPNDEDESRWDTKALRRLGLESRGRVRHNAAYQLLVKVATTPRDFPRAVGVPGKNPLF